MGTLIATAIILTTVAAGVIAATWVAERRRKRAHARRTHPSARARIRIPAQRNGTHH